MGLCRDCQRDISASWCLGRYRYDDRRLIRKVRWVLRWLPEHNVIIWCAVYVGLRRHCKKSSAATDTPYLAPPIDKAIIHVKVDRYIPSPATIADITAVVDLDLAISLSTPPLPSVSHFPALSRHQGKLNKRPLPPA